MTLLQAIVYGVIQGLTEYLPVSSSAHLVLLPVFTGWKDPGLAFDVGLHWGTLVAVLAYFRKDVIKLVMGFAGYLGGHREYQNRLPAYLVLATVPGALLGLMFEKQAETIFRSPWILAFTLTGMGLLLLYSDRHGSKSLSLADLTWKTAIMIGLSQGLAIVPGVSRSGITITTALLVGFERADAVRFSFLLSMPIIFGAGLLKADYLLQSAGDPIIWIALCASAVSGFAAIKILIGYVRTRSFLPFVVYRILLAAVIVLWLIFKTL